MLIEFLFSSVTLGSDLCLPRKGRVVLKKIRVRKWLSGVKGLHCKPGDPRARKPPLRASCVDESV